jgi:hypothetical protein
MAPAARAAALFLVYLAALSAVAGAVQLGQIPYCNGWGSPPATLSISPRGLASVAKKGCSETYALRLGIPCGRDVVTPASTRIPIAPERRPRILVPPVPCTCFSGTPSLGCKMEGWGCEVGSVEGCDELGYNVPGFNPNPSLPYTPAPHCAFYTR